MPKKLKTLREVRNALQLAEGYIPVPAVAKALKISVQRAYALVSSGLIAGRKVAGAVYVEKAALEAYQASLKAPPGWILVADAVARYNYGRSAILARTKLGQIGRQVFGGWTYLKVSDLNARCKPRK